MVDKVAILEAWDTDGRVVEIAEKHGVTPARIYQIVAERDKTPGQPGRPRKVDPAAVVAAIEDGARPAHVAVAFGITRGRVSQILPPELKQSLRAARDANITERTVKERALRERRQTAGPVPPAPKRKAKPIDPRKRPANWKTVTTKALKTTKNQREAAAKLGLSLGGLRKRVREMQRDA